MGQHWCDLKIAGAQVIHPQNCLNFAYVFTTVLQWIIFLMSIKSNTQDLSIDKPKGFNFNCDLQIEIGNLEEKFEIGEKLGKLEIIGNLKGKLEIRGKNWKLGKNIRNLEMNLG